MMKAQRSANVALAATLVGLFLSGCSSTKLSRLDDVTSNEAIVVAKFRILYNGQDATKGSNVIFNLYTGRKFLPKYQNILDESGYVVTKLPIGANSIDNLVHKSGFLMHHFPAGELSFLLTGGGVVNYLGDITIDWHGIDPKEVRKGCVSCGAAEGGTIVVSVHSNVTGAQEVFQKNFTTDRSVTPSLLQVLVR